MPFGGSVNYADQMFIGSVEEHNKTAGTYVVSPYNNRGNYSKWIKNVVLVRNYRGIHQHNIIGCTVLCVMVDSMCYIIGVIGRNIRDDFLTFDLGNFVKLIVDPSGTVSLRMESDEKVFDIAKFDISSDGTFDFNLSNLRINILSAGEPFIDVKTSDTSRDVVYSINMCSDLLNTANRLSIKHQKNNSTIYVDGEDHVFSISHSHRRAANNPNLITGSKSVVKVTKDGVEIESSNPTDARGKSIVKITDSEIIIDAGMKNITITGGNVTITGGQVNLKGTTIPDPSQGGPFNCLRQCLFTGAPHSGNKVINT